MSSARRSPRLSASRCGGPRTQGDTPGLPTKSLGFGGFDSSRLLSLKGGNSHAGGML